MITAETITHEQLRQMHRAALDAGDTERARTCERAAGWAPCSHEQRRVALVVCASVLTRNGAL